MMFLAVVAVLLSPNADAATLASCEGLASLKLPAARITLAKGPHAEGIWSDDVDLPDVCRVTATLTPSSSSEIKIEIWLPSSGWNGKLQAVGNGGWSGNVNRSALLSGVRRGYATVATDTGHAGGAGPWMQNREKLIDFGYRAIHEMTVTAKAIVDAFYGKAPRFSYFTGCSGGGRQALMEAQRYPDDFDGVVAGSPSLNATGRAAFSMWVAQNLRKEDGSYIPQTKYAAIHKAVLNACDALDGVQDGVVGNPAQCAFDPKAIECKSADSDTCLTPPQVEAARTIYQPLINARTKEEIAPGLSPGSELGWATFGGQEPFGLGREMFRYLVFNDPAWSYKALNFDSDMALVAKVEAGVLNATNPDLHAFFASGGKLIQYHGWADPQIQPLSSVRYYEGVLQRMGDTAAVKDHYRLFMVPGMAHCSGGTGTSTFDMLAALERWVEHGTPPDSVPASRVIDGRPDRTRPLCPYPQQAAYKGSGDVNEAANFVCR
jgi:feruloyl esterase